MIPAPVLPERPTVPQKLALGLAALDPLAPGNEMHLCRPHAARYHMTSRSQQKASASIFRCNEPLHNKPSAELMVLGTPGTVEYDQVNPSTLGVLANLPHS